MMAEEYGCNVVVSRQFMWVMRKRSGTLTYTDVRPGYYHRRFTVPDSTKPPFEVDGCSEVKSSFVERISNRSTQAFELSGYIRCYHRSGLCISLWYSMDFLTFSPELFIQYRSSGAVWCRHPTKGIQSPIQTLAVWKDLFGWKYTRTKHGQCRWIWG